MLVGAGALAFMLWEPHIEGRNAHATLFEIYFKDPFLACAYIASVPFFAALYQAFRALGYVGQNRTFSQATVKALRTIKYCAIVITGFAVAAEAYLFIVRPGDDIAGGVFMGILITLGSLVSAAAAARFERILKNAVDLKPGNDSTV